jgi:tetratricopeptide (TPR) repeat protein
MLSNFKLIGLLAIVVLAYFGCATTNVVDEQQVAQARGLNQQAGRYYQQGNFRQAESLWLQAYSINPNVTDYVINAALSQYGSGRTPVALNTLRRSIGTIRDKREVAFDYMGVMYMEMGNMREAIKNFKKALSIDNSYAPSYHNLGVALFRINLNNEGLENINKAIQINSSNAVYFFNRARLFAQNNQPESAINDYKASISIDPTLVDAYYNVALSYEAMGEYTAAIEYFTLTIQVDPQNYDALYNRAVIYFQINDLEKSLVDALAAQKMANNINRPKVNNLLTVIRWTMGEQEQSAAGGNSRR